MSLFSDIVPRDDPLNSTPEIRVTSEDLAERVSDVVVDKLKPIILSTSKNSQLSEAVLSQIEDKLDRLLQWQEEAKPTACKDRAYCQGCGGNQHPYERCEEKKLNMQKM